MESVRRTAQRNQSKSQEEYLGTSWGGVVKIRYRHQEGARGGTVMHRDGYRKAWYPRLLGEKSSKIYGVVSSQREKVWRRGPLC